MAAREGGEDDRRSRSMILACHILASKLTVWTAEDKEQLVRLSNKEINMSETYLGRYAALQKRTAVAAILDFTNKEWESMRGLREADGAFVVADGIVDITGALGNGNKTTGDTIEEGAV